MHELYLFNRPTGRVVEQSTGKHSALTISMIGWVIFVAFFFVMDAVNNLPRYYGFFSTPYFMSIVMFVMFLVVGIFLDAAVRPRRSCNFAA